MADPISTPLEWALRELRDSARQAAYAKAHRYYNGVHPMLFATDKFRSTFGKSLGTLHDNLCPAVVDSISDRLKVTGIDAGVNGSAELAAEAWEVWQRNRMDLRAAETHDEALKAGDGYALVWPIEGEATIWALDACDVAVAYDPRKPGVLKRAARLWQDDDDMRVHIDIYTPTTFERYVTRGARKSATLTANTRAREFLPYTSEGGNIALEGREPNPFGRVPLVHFPNKAYHRYGRSELVDVYPLQDALNKTLCDLMVNNEFAAYRQRYATGYDASEGTGSTDGNISEYGVDRMMWSSDADTRFGNFDVSPAQGFLETSESFRSEVARVSGTPLHYLFITRGDFPSGEAMKSAEARFTRKIENRQASFGNQWEDLLSLALRMEGAADDVDGRMLSTVWESAEPTGLRDDPAAGPAPADDDAQPGRNRASSDDESSPAPTAA